MSEFMRERAAAMRLWFHEGSECCLLRHMLGSFTAFADGAAASALVYWQILPSAAWSFQFWSYSATAKPLIVAC